MNMRIIASALALSTALLGTSISVTPVRADTTVVVEDTPPTFVEEGATINGAVVVAPADVDYVTIDGAWYYYHPGLHTWVHVNHDKDWHPDAKAHIYHKWSEHPMYHRRDK